MCGQPAASILYVDDDRVVRQLVTQLFRRAGFVVREAGTGHEALRLATERPDLIVLDVQLPDVSGFEVCRRIKAEPSTSTIPVLHLSGEYTSSEDRVQGLEGGADGYLVKPVAPEVLLASVRSLLRIKQTEEELRASHDLLRAVTEGTTDAIFVKDLQGRYLMINSAGARFLDKTVTEVLGKDDTELFSPDTAQEIMAHDRGVMAAGETQTFEDIGTAAGVTRTYLSTKGPYRDRHGQVIGLIGISRDITARKRAEEALAEAQQRYKRLLESVTDYVYTVKLENGRPATTSHGPGCVAVTGYTPEEYAANPLLWYQMIHEEDRNAVLEQATRLYAREATSPIEHRIRHKDGSVRWVTNTAVPRYDDHGGLVAYDGLIADITQRKRAEEAVRRAEEGYRSIFEHAVEGIFQSTPEGLFLTANPALARMLGFASPEELIASVTDIGRQLHVSPERRAEFGRLLAEHGSVQGFEAQVYHKDGGVLWIALTGRAVRDERGTLLYFEGIVEDITERKQAEELLQARARQQAAVAVLGHRALASTDLATLMDEAVASVAQTLEVSHCAIFELLPDRQTLGLQAGIGWHDDCVGRAKVGAGAESLAGYTLSCQAPVSVPDLHTDTRFRVPSLLLDHAVVSAVSVIVPAANQPFGVLAAYTTAKRQFLQDDMHYLEAVAHVLATAIERRQAEERLLAARAESRIARRIQQKLFPASVPQVTGFDISGRAYGFDIGGASYPAEATGGDYFDYIPLLDGGLGIVIGDVSGHGVGPALLMAEARAYLRALARTHARVSEIMTLANEVLAADIEDGRFITLLFARLDPQTRSLVYSSAGHSTCYILDEAGRVKHALPSTSVPLGVTRTCDFRSSTALTLETGDLILLFTDGLVEARSPDDTLFGIERVFGVVRAYRRDAASQIVANLYHAVRAFTQNTPQHDDITAVVVRIGPNS
jgi:PAS domain S-box-containing protein